MRRWPSLFAMPTTHKSDSGRPPGGSTTISIEELQAEAEQNPPDPAEVVAGLRDFAHSAVFDATGHVRALVRQAAEVTSETRARWAELAIPPLDFSGDVFSESVAQLIESLADVQEVGLRRLPPNWPKDTDWEQLVTVIQTSGIPLVWVPRADIVSAVAEASTQADRIGVILTHTDEIAADCRASLAEVDDPALAGQVTLAQSAVDAFAAHHFQAAQALAVVVTETAIANVLRGNYQEIKKQVQVDDPGELTLADLRLRAALAPINAFFTPWRPSWGTPAPEELSRHVSVHQADVSHYTVANAHISILLVASVLPALAEALAVVRGPS